jgi:hypothetical protein
MSGGLTRWSTHDGWLASPIGAPDTIATVKAVFGDRAYVVTTDHKAVGYDDQRGWFTSPGRGLVRTLDATSDASGYGQITTIALDSSVEQFGDGGPNHPTPLMYATFPVSVDSISVTPSTIFGLATSGTIGYSQPPQFRLIPAGTVLDFSATSPERVYAERPDGSIAYQDDSNGWITLPPL